ncbi:PQ-loop-domain-containing protein [Mollisia scopiformis]|uniref:PQ-loop-domain-containing protein n=1 Tax=Mollisia scopiformis TaxID=149040 RepID=A0A132BDU2_MOLSC|nr:PQ-loop-domain-containing protein [Mollisia scopiformis]KUJ09837.1 PQ-loop-domain-containing protein [Mollisia scopiformis]
MAPQTSIPVAANVLGTIGTGCWCVQLIPQIWTNYRTKNTEGLPGIMMFLWAICAVPFGAYSITQNFNIPIQVQPQCFGTFCLISWAQTLIYHDKWPVWKASTLGFVVWALFGGAEAALILTLRPLYDRGIDFPMIILGVIASILLALGLLPPYLEIWKRRGRVIGINWIFLTIDWSGAFFSLMALVAQNTFDVLGGVLYIICVILEAGIFVCHLIWMFRTRKIRAHAKSEGKTFDDIAKECEEQDGEFKFAEREIKIHGRRKKDDASKVSLGDVEVEKI